ncbi:hypothetical protein DXG01_010002, partial [Tephrocybe rancida]
DTQHNCGLFYKAITSDSSAFDSDDEYAMTDPLQNQEDLDLPSLDDVGPLPPETPVNPTSVPRDPPLQTTFHKQYHPNRAGSISNDGANLLQILEQDEYAEYRNGGNPHYPFANQAEWELMRWMNGVSLTRQQIDAFLKLAYRHQTFTYPRYKTKDPITIFWRDPLEVVKALYSNPIFTPCIELNPYKLYPSLDSDDRMYTEFMSGDFAWDYQSTLQIGHSFVGIILASDKTPLTIGTGNCEMHPLLISITNIDAGVRMKATSHAFALIAYLPIVKFADVTDHEQSILKARLFHLCLDKILGPLKVAEEQGELMSDSLGRVRAVHTPLAVYIADYPEQQLVSAATNKSDPYPSSALRALEPYWRVCQAYGLNGVVNPFWRDWGSACPSIFLTHDPLHGLHKFFWDHVVKWAINIMTGPELDVWIKVLQPRVGVKHWANGVSKLKQVTGREYRELEKVFIAVINGGVDSRVMRALRALVDFIFQAQNLVFFGETMTALSTSTLQSPTYSDRSPRTPRTPIGLS